MQISNQNNILSGSQQPRPKARREKQAARLVLTSRAAMLMSEGKKLQEPFLSLICLAPN